MGAGCYYTHKDSNVENKRAFWIDLDYYPEGGTNEEDYDHFLWDDTIMNLTYIFEDIGYDQVNEYVFENGLFRIELESGHGGEIVVRFEPKGEDSYDWEDKKLYNLALANHARSYERIKKTLLGRGYELRIATSGYTSTSLNPE